jgi:hypothetical protein
MCKRGHLRAYSKMKVPEGLGATGSTNARWMRGALRTDAAFLRRADADVADFDARQQAGAR